MWICIHNGGCFGPFNKEEDARKYAKRDIYFSVREVSQWAIGTHRELIHQCVDDAWPEVIMGDWRASDGGYDASIDDVCKNPDKFVKFLGRYTK